MARPAKVGGLRTTRADDPHAVEDLSLPSDKQGVYQFRSKAAAFRLSLRRRRIERGPDGEKEEVSPRSKDGHDAPLDLVVFEDNYYETPSRELAELIVKRSKELGLYGVGAGVWSLEDEKAARNLAMERELRARIEASPEVAAKLGIRLTPSDAQDIELPPPVA
jgi:hypothetical protein